LKKERQIAVEGPEMMASMHIPMIVEVGRMWIQRGIVACARLLAPSALGILKQWGNVLLRWGVTELLPILHFGYNIMLSETGA